jgi:activator of 2-hydroxyglutaryl-CoA dehydratase
MKQYEYTTGYLLTEEAQDINIVTNLMNNLGEDGWHFTGYAKVVQNGTFYFFARVKETVVNMSAASLVERNF